MIPKTLTVRNIEMTVQFEGDPSVQWYVEVIGSNAINPTIKGMANGSVTLVFVPECLNRKVDLMFHESSEKAVVDEIDDAMQDQKKITLLKLKTKNWIMETVKQFPKLTMMFISIAIGLLLADVFFAPEDDPNKFTNIWKNLSAAGAANALEEFYESSDETALILTNNHPVFESDAIKEIEEQFVDSDGEPQLSFRAMFKYVGRGHFIMKDLIENEDGIMKFEYGDAEDQCEMIETQVAEGNVLDQFFPVLGVSEKDDVAEWGAESDGMFSDNYLVYIKDAEMPDGAYKKDGRVFVDGDDVELAARCMFRASDFQE